MQPPSPPGARNVLAALILAIATAGIVLGGFGIIFSLAFELVGPHQPAGYSPPASAGFVAGMMVAFGSTVVGVIAMMLIKLFARMMGLSSLEEKPERGPRALVSPQRVAQIASPMGSVTEHTTRNFETQDSWNQQHRE